MQVSINYYVLNFNRNHTNKITFSGIKPQKEVVAKAIRHGNSKIDYSQFDPYFLRILIDEGCSLSEIAHDIKQKVSTTRCILRHFNLKTQLAMLLDSINPKELKQMLDAKKSQKEIAEHFMIDDFAALTPLIKKIGENPATQNKVNSIPEEELQEFADKGFSLAKIGEHYHVSAKFIRDKMQELGIKTKRELSKEKTITIEEIKHYIFDCGWSTEDISRSRGIPIGRIYKIMKENNVKTPKQQIIERIPTKEEFIEARKVCNTMKEYTAKLGIGQDKAIKYMAEYNIKPFRVVIKDPSNILELLKKNPNISVDEIARELDLPPRAVDAAISKFKIPIMHTSYFYRSVISSNTARKFNENIAMGDTPTQLGEQYGLSSNRIVEIANSINDYESQYLKYNSCYEEYLVKNCDLSTCKPSPNKEAVENCIKKICDSWENLQKLRRSNYKIYTNNLQTILKELHISEDTLDYLIKKYNIA